MTLGQLSRNRSAFRPWSEAAEDSSAAAAMMQVTSKRYRLQPSAPPPPTPSSSRAPIDTQVCTRDLQPRQRLYEA